MKEIFEKIKGIQRLLLFLDYDGTIVPIKTSPELAKLHPLRRKSLKKLSEKIPVTLVSGRDLRELRNLIALDTVSFIGNHGFEIFYKGKTWIHPEGLRLKDILKVALKKVENKIGTLKGVKIEYKGLTASIHFRKLRKDSTDYLEKILENEIGKYHRELEIRKGKKVFEIRPALDWDKGKAVEKLLPLMDPKGECLRIYIGDDETDEDVFKIFTGDDLTILVGRKRDSYAKYRLKNVEEVWNFLKFLLKSIS